MPYESLNLSWEKKWWNKGFRYVVGVDEVGRGSLAGPVVAAGVVFPSQVKPIKGVNDSKKLSSNQRGKLEPIIKRTASDYALASVSVKVINQKGIEWATMEAMKRVVKKMKRTQVVLVDGNRAPRLPKEVEVKSIVGGDNQVYSIAAASILAKEYRDRLMRRLNRKYCAYGFAENKGYGTQKHRQAIYKYGVTICHRKLFVRKILVDNGNN